MQNPDWSQENRPNPERAAEDLSRAGELVTGRLTALGIELDGSESPEQLEQLAEAVERFEDAVESRGGDLMVAEPPRDSETQPDNSDFVLPRRRADESVISYLNRLRDATDRVLARPPR